MKLFRKSKNLEGASLFVREFPDAFGSLDTNVCNREAVGQRCDVTNWDSQLALFELGISSFGVIDVVVCPPSETGCIVLHGSIIGGKCRHQRSWHFLQASGGGRET